MTPPSKSPAPSLSAVMCDGMGWFSKTDFKRMLLLYDRILYLVPTSTVEFRDLDGRSNYILIPKDLEKVGFQFEHFEPNEVVADAIIQSAKIDASRPAFADVVATIPEFDRRYTWRITNADADLGRGRSVNLRPDEEVLAHAMLLNKFLLAADLSNAIPITGKQYIHSLVIDKYRAAQSVNSESAGLQKIAPPSLGPIAVQVMQAIVSDEELEQHTEIEIIEYKFKHRSLFENFSYAIRKLVKQVSALPGSPNFDRQVSELISTEVWRDKTEVERELRNAWAGFFKSTVKSAVAGAVTLGITPFLSLGTLGIGSVLASVAAAAPWATAELINILEKRKQVEQHGMYYLINFKS